MCRGRRCLAERPGRCLTAVAANCRQAGIGKFVLAYLVTGRDMLRRIEQAAGVPLRVVRLWVPLAVIERRLAADVTTERQQEPREAVGQIAAGAGVGVEDLELDGDRPVGVLAQEIMSWLGWA